MTPIRARRSVGCRPVGRRRPSPRPRRAVLAAVALVAACSGGSGHPTVAPRPATTSSSPAASGCGHPAGSSTVPITDGGHPREVVVHVPGSYRGAPVALVLDLHGSGSTAGEQELLSGMDATADRDGFIVAYPQGLIASGTGFDWNVPGQPLFGGASPPPGAADDVRFLSDLVGDLAARYCIDRSRVYATGISGGGRMASQLACDAPATFAAVAPVAGLRYPDACPATRAVPVVAFHGTADPIDPYDGNGQAYWTYSVPTAAARWAAHDGCATTPVTTSGAGYTLTRYQDCRDGASVELYTVIGEGHTWPGGPLLRKSITRVLGPQSAAVDADAAMWGFFTSS